MRRLCGTVLAMEAVIALLAIVPAKVLGHTSAGTAAAVCGAVAVIAIVLSGVVGKRPWALYAGSVFQLAVIACGVLMSAMYVLGVIFAIIGVAVVVSGIWYLITSIRLAKRSRGRGRPAHTAQRSNVDS